jgi:5-keto-L-gluconate epimerase
MMQSAPVRVAASITPNRTKFGPLLFSGEVERGLSWLAELGYQGVELSLRTKDDMDIGAFAKSLDILHLKLFSIATGQSYVEDRLSLFAADENAREGTVKRLKDHMDIAAEFGASVIVGGIRGKVAENDAAQLEEGKKAIDRCIEYAERKKIVLLLEPINRYETNVFNSLEEARRFLVSRRSAYLRLLPDTFHMNIEEADMEASLEASRGWIGALHCADSNRLAPGMGHIDFSGILKKAVNFPQIQYFGVEVLPLPDSIGAARKAIETIRKATES